MKTSVKYAPDYISIHYNTGRNPVNRSATGYGNSIPTPYLAHDGKTLRRVYAICYSNCASHYIRMNGERLFIQDWRFDEASNIYKNF